MTIAKVYLAAGSVVPRHSHHHEQVTMMESGRLLFRFDDHEQIVQAGECLEIPPHVPHEVIAEVDSVATDLFSPFREDWQSGDDAYLRSAPSGGSR